MNWGYKMLPEEIEEFEQLLKEAVIDAERALSLEDAGYIKLGSGNSLEMDGATRQNYVKRSRYYYNLDPLANQAIRLWTDYTFGSGISCSSDNERVQAALDAFWNNPDNRKLLSESGQRKSSDKCLVDGEVFFALFLGPAGEVRIRWIDPLEITEIITDPDDKESVRYYKREWVDPQGGQHAGYYRDVRNKEDISTPDSSGKVITASEDALVYHLPFHTIGQRGNPLLLPVIDWIDQYRRFLAARISIVRALARFAWKNKVMGGAAAVTAAKAVTQGKYPQAGSTLIENMGSNTEPIKTDTGAANAKDDGRMLKLQICSGVGIPEQYFGDIATGNLATAKTVELPMLKQFGSYQGLWRGAWKDIFDVVLDHNNIPEVDRFVDIDFPEIAPSDALSALTAIGQLITSFPDLGDVDDVVKQALINIGLNNVDNIIKKLEKVRKENEKKRPPVQPGTTPNNQFPNNRPLAQESAEVRAIKALYEIRRELENHAAVS